MNKSGAKTFLVTSAGPGEGKSTTITNTAVVFAQAGKKTLLVGANMRRPKMDRIFGLERERGLANILAGEITWREALKDFRDVALGERAGEGLASAPGMDNLFFISTGGRTNQPAEWLSLPEFEALLKEWKEQFDVILIDAPPLLPVPDSVIISKVVDAVIVVYQVGVAARESMRRALSLLHTSGANVMGIVLNDIRSSWAEDANLQHYRGYYGPPGRK